MIAIRVRQNSSICGRQAAKNFLAGKEMSKARAQRLIEAQSRYLYSSTPARIHHFLI
jgi:hypothetical protein